MALLLLVPMAAAQNPIVAAHVVGESDLYMANMQVVLPEAGVSSEGCDSPGAVAIVGDRAFRFREESNQAGCAEARFQVRVPAGAQSFELRFLADRRIEQNFEPPTVQVRPQLVQELRVYDEGGNQTGVIPIYLPTDPEQTAPRSFEYLIQVPTEAETVSLGWYFEDDSVSPDVTLAPGAGQSLSSTVREPMVSFPPRELPPAMLVSHTNTTRDSDILEQQVVSLELPPLMATADRTDIVATLLSTVHLVAVTGADGTRFAAGELAVLQQGGTQTVTVPFAGIGAYQFELQSTRALPPPPPPAPPTTVLALLVVALAVTGGSLAGAIANHEYSRRVLGKARRGQWTRRAIELALLVIASIVYVSWLFWRQWDAVTIWPLGRWGVILYAGLLFLAASAAGHWAVGALQRRVYREHVHAQALEAKNLELTRSNRDLEQFAYVASHDLQEPLRKVSSYTTLLQRRYEGRLDEKADNYIDQAHAAAQRARGLIADVLAFSRIGNSDEAFEDVELSAVLADVEADLAESLTASQAVLVVEPLPRVHGAPRLLRQLFINLVQNGVKYHHPDRRPEIKVDAVKDKGQWRIRVTDNGVGIPPEHRERIFQLFQRLHGREFQGSGIGLAICKRIAEHHGGDIWVEDASPGSRFCVTLPVARSMREAGR